MRLEQPNDSAKFGHDAPLIMSQQDYFNRWQLASAISQVILAAPIQWSTRIGLYGKWGTGKTSVLNFIHGQQREKGNIVVRFSPWSIHSQEQAWTALGESVIEGLAAEGISLSKLKHLRLWLALHIPSIERALRWFGKLAESSTSTPGLESASEFLAKSHLKKLELSREWMNDLRQKLGKKRVVVVIDDLDRTDPKVIPTILLSLRDVLDYPHFTFILAFDQEVVEQALAQASNAWSSNGCNFLDKIIDFHFSVSPPTNEQILAFGKSEFSLSAPFIAESYVDELAGLLPSNPRKLKLFVRMIGSMGKEAARHGDGELNWSFILCYSLLSSESQQLASSILKSMDDDGELNWVRTFLREDEEEQRRQEEFTEQLVSSDPRIQVGERARIARLISRLRQLCQGKRPAMMAYQVRFATNPDCMTWKELRTFIEQWRLNKNAELIGQFVRNQAISLQVSTSQVAQELLSSLCELYSVTLDEASNQLGVDEHSEKTRFASDVLDLLSRSISGNVESSISTRLKLSTWTALYKACFGWQHFVGNRDDLALRELELNTLITSGRAIDPLEIWGALKPWQPEEHAISDHVQKRRALFNEGLVREFEPHVLEVVLRFVSTPGQLDQLGDESTQESFRRLLLSPNSPCFSREQEARLVEALRHRTANETSRIDALRWLDLLLACIPNGDRYCTEQARAAFMREKSLLVAQIWRLFVQRPAQFRFLHEIQSRRQTLLRLGVDEAVVALPDWLT